MVIFVTAASFCSAGQVYWDFRRDKIRPERRKLAIVFGVFFIVCGLVSTTPIIYKLIR